ncbi:hypothetical protein EYZ11_011781 [Aspergillus tanneri]|uniref:Uncharacterized protein n=1 Tax=Aspergillus tanneri TaxID=1220188 RepID=A0A4S3J423_9EURO|nr:hypothetical protein EYZ11_011781 [Aspergillus tanneri]
MAIYGLAEYAQQDSRCVIVDAERLMRLPLLNPLSKASAVHSQNVDTATNDSTSLGESDLRLYDFVLGALAQSSPSYRPAHLVGIAFPLPFTMSPPYRISLVD